MKFMLRAVTADGKEHFVEYATPYKRIVETQKIFKFNGGVTTADDGTEIDLNVDTVEFVDVEEY